MVIKIEYEVVCLYKSYKMKLGCDEHGIKRIEIIDSNGESTFIYNSDIYEIVDTAFNDFIGFIEDKDALAYGDNIGD